MLFAGGLEDGEIMALSTATKTASTEEAGCMCNGQGKCTGCKKALAQWKPVKVATAKGKLPDCHGNNGPDGVNCEREVCDGTNGLKDGPTGTPCTREEPAKGDEPPTTTGNLLPTYPGGDLPEAAAAAATPAKKTLLQLDQQPFPQYEALAPEKVLVPQTTWARYHSTYY
jgi:hypothetical protein